MTTDSTHEARCGAACSTCRFFCEDRGKRLSRPGKPYLLPGDKLNLEYAGLCRRFPTSINKWPESWCGEYQEKRNG